MVCKRTTLRERNRVLPRPLAGPSSVDDTNQDSSSAGAANQPRPNGGCRARTAQRAHPLKRSQPLRGSRWALGSSARQATRDARCVGLRPLWRWSEPRSPRCAAQGRATEARPTQARRRPLAWGCSPVRAALSGYAARRRRSAGSLRPCRECRSRSRPTGSRRR